MADKSNTNVMLKVYDTSKNVIIDAKFNAAKNTFDYFNVAQSQQAEEGVQQQQQPGMQQYPAGMRQQQPRMGRMA